MRPWWRAGGENPPSGYGDDGKTFERYGPRGGYVWHAFLHYDEVCRKPPAWIIVHESRFSSAAPGVVLSAKTEAEAVEAFREFCERMDAEMLARCGKRSGKGE